MEIRITQAESGRLKPKPTDESNLGFGNILTDHMFLMNYKSGKGWINPRIEPYANLSIDPAAMGIHYGQEIFEGLLEREKLGKLEYPDSKRAKECNIPRELVRRGS